MKRTVAAIAAMAISAFAVEKASAAEVLTFEGLQNLESVDSYYDGGTGGFGSGPGPNYGVTFTSDSLAVISLAGGGTGNFSNNPSGDTVLFFLNGAGDTMNVASGFTTGFSFFYAAAAPGSVQVFSGLDGTGTLLASLDLATTQSPYSVWSSVGVSFGGTAESVIFSGSANFIGFDDITLGSVTAGVPEPETWALMIMGMGIAGGVVRRRRRSALAAA